MTNTINQELEYEELHQPKIVGPIFKVASKLLVQLNNHNEQHENIIISPICIHRALSLLLLGSNFASRTKKALQDSLGYANMDEYEIQQCHKDYARVLERFERITQNTVKNREKFEAIKRGEDRNMSDYELRVDLPRSPVINLFSMLMTKYTEGQVVQSHYERDAARYYHSSIWNMDDQNSEEKHIQCVIVNKRAREAGFEDGRPLMDYLDSNFHSPDSLLILSSIRLEAFWPMDFEELDGKGIFYNYGARDQPVDGQCLSVKLSTDSNLLEFTSNELAKVKLLHKTMSKRAIFRQLSRLNFRAILIPLKGGLSFVIFEPIIDPLDEPSKTTLGQLYDLIDDLLATSDPNNSKTNLEHALGLLDSSVNENYQLVSFRMPKFRIEKELNDLKVALKSVGLRRLFDRDSAELSNMKENKLCLSDIKHKAMIATTKTGIKPDQDNTTTRAQTSYSMGLGSPPVEVNIENPFMFVVRYKKIPLLMGQLTNLKATASPIVN
uniref:Serpin B10 n=1 Tax=Aceria tosichella TaxID=561515 RepID=A0A6G1SPY0_9ACAR